MPVYTCVGDPAENLAFVEDLAAQRGETTWTINSKARPGDQVLFYWTAPVSAIGARGVVLSEPAKLRRPRNDWSRNYFADIGDVRLLPRLVENRELRQRSPNWGWLKSPIKSSRVPDEVVDWLRELELDEGPALPDVDVELDGRPEGAPRLVEHFRRERDRALVKRKRDAVLRATGRLACEACDLDFSEFYGGLGELFCEVHHLRPLAELTKPVPTKLKELAVVCSNCHRMIHRSDPMLTPIELRNVIAAAGAPLPRAR